ncbi:hypothetical protein OHT52_04810 [Streptomyces sp. NBC_00247]|uniref:hypothetical protein n=1 Tax=Streptomyces sp. NBC_00247 TaxID=2975689 RepID=UPI002E2D76AD|nr:hypothetical protein [Streptomyces sp. NBC_00247]
MALLMSCALLLAALAAVLASATQAHAFTTIGSLRLTPSSGSIDTPLLVTRVETDGPCPADTVTSTLAVDIPGTDFAGNLAKLESAPSTTEAFSGTLADNVGFPYPTLKQRLLNAVPDASLDGVYTIGLNCGLNAADAPAFTVLIKVEGDSWSVLEQKTTGITLSSVPAQPEPGTAYTLVANVAPEGAAGRVTLGSKSTETAEPVTVGEADVVDGKAEFALTAPATSGSSYFHLAFAPTDTQSYAPSESDGYLSFLEANTPTTPPPTTPAPGGSEDLVVTDSEGNILEADPALEPGDTVKITAHGFTASATVKADLDGGTALADATADAEGTVDEYAFTVPDDIEDGDHTLTLAEDASGGQSVGFAFTTGAEATDDPTDGPTADPSDTTGPDASTGGSDTGGSGSGGSDGGLGTDSGSGSGGALASTGAQLGTAALGGLALIAAGAALVVHVRRKGMLRFGVPRH